MNSYIRLNIFLHLVSFLSHTKAQGLATAAPRSTSVDSTINESSVRSNRGGVFNSVQSGKYHLSLTACAQTFNTTISLQIDDGDVIDIESEQLMPNTYNCFFYVQVQNSAYLHFVLEHFALLRVKYHRIECSLGAELRVRDQSGIVSSFPSCGPDRVWQTVPTRDGWISMSLWSDIPHWEPVLHLSLRLTFRSAALPVTELLSQEQKSPHTASLTSFLFTGKARIVPTENVIFHIIPGLRAGTTMLSIPHMGIRCEGYLRLQVQGEFLTFTADMQIWTICGTAPRLAQLVRGSVTVEYKASTNPESTGFKLLYSYHGVAETPQFGSQGTARWNCSVPFYENFKQHVHCNLVRECQKLEDETSCPYTSSECGPGNIEAGTKCYKHFKIWTPIAWHRAVTECRIRNMTLVSPKTPLQWQQFIKIMEFGLSSSDVFVGLSYRIPEQGIMQNVLWQWCDGTVAYFLPYWSNQDYSHESCLLFDRASGLYRCSQCSLSASPSLLTKRVDCTSDTLLIEDVMCEYPKPGNTRRPISASRHLGPKMNTPDPRFNETSFFTCPEGHVVHSFMVCDKESQCGQEKNVYTCTVPGTEISIPMFECDLGAQTLYYSLVCDHRADCLDRSDEAFCMYRPCIGAEFTCRDGKCINPRSCDGIRNCVDGSDEECNPVLTLPYTMPPPAVVDINWRGDVTLHSLANGTCPETHFQCRDGYCLPVFLVCNGVRDCFHHDDEADCDNYKCPGFYRCRGSRICVHADHVGDKIPHCPQHDDELLRAYQCPWQCRCQGLAFICVHDCAAFNYPSIRYLDYSGSGVQLATLRYNLLLIRLSMSACGIKNIDQLKFPNLQYIDLSHNQLTSINTSAFSGSPNLRVIVLAGNPLVSLESFGLYPGSSTLMFLDISHTRISAFDRAMLGSFPGLQRLSATNVTLKLIADNVFGSTPRLDTLDLRDSFIPQLPENLLQNLSSLTAVSASDFRLCCPALLPEKFTMRFCEAPQDEISSCEDLLRSDFYRACLWLMVVLAVTGNTGSLATRILSQRTTSIASFTVLVTNLNMADLLMGVYMVIIGAADTVYRGRYLWQESNWRNSVICKVAGFLCLWASEVSAFFICLITLDRFLALRFLFGGARLTAQCAAVACGLAWLAGFVLALLPLLPATAHWHFYSQTGICIPLPITRGTSKGRPYAFGVMVVLNFCLFLVIALGQLLIYASVRQHSFTSDSRSSQDATVARRLTTIVLSDFLCWFPVGVLGLLASSGSPVSSEVNVIVAVFVVPLNSAINPFLCTLNIVLERKRKAAETRLLERLTKTLVAQRRTRDVGVLTEGVPL